MHFEQYGQGVPIICLHGFSVDHRLMTGCLEPIFEHTNSYRRIYPDLPGMGKTPAPEWLKNADDMLNIVTAFINEIIGDEPFLVIGESYGGYLAQGLLHKMQHRVKGTFLLCSVIQPDIDKRILPKHRALAVDDSFSPSEQFLSTAVVATPQAYGAYKRDIWPGLQAADAGFLDGYRKEGYAFSFHDALANVHFDGPATFLMGRQDAITGYADALALLDNYPRATFAILDFAGHNLQIESPALFAVHIKDWLRRVSYET